MIDLPLTYNLAQTRKKCKSQQALHYQSGVAFCLTFSEFLILWYSIHYGLTQTSNTGVFHEVSD